MGCADSGFSDSDAASLDDAGSDDAGSDDAGSDDAGSDDTASPAADSGAEAVNSTGSAVAAMVSSPLLPVALSAALFFSSDGLAGDEPADSFSLDLLPAAWRFSFALVADSWAFRFAPFPDFGLVLFAPAFGAFAIGTPHFRFRDDSHRFAKQLRHRTESKKTG